MLVEVAQVHPMFTHMINAVVQTVVAGQIVRKISHPKNVSMVSRIANGCSIVTKWYIKLSGISKAKTKDMH